MTGSAKQKTLILLGLVMIITVIIAASLLSIGTPAGMPLPRVENGQVVISPDEARPSGFLGQRVFQSTFCLYPGRIGAVCDLQNDQRHRLGECSSPSSSQSL